MKKIYNPAEKRLEFFEQQADGEFWDRHWRQQWSGQEDELIKKVIYKKDALIEALMNKYLPDKKSKVLEAGCGLGRLVYLLNHLGYEEIYGIDYASKTVNALNNFFPALKIYKQSVDQTNFPENFFDGYISLGVIEHFREGPNKILDEAKRIVKPDGRLFISFPHMSPLRKIKAGLGLYSTNLQKNQKSDGNDFYQFAFNTKFIAKDFKKLGFSIEKVITYGSLKGLKDEVAILRPITRRLYNYKGKSRFIKKFIRRLDIFLNPFSSHMAMFILKNVKS